MAALLLVKEIECPLVPPVVAPVTTSIVAVVGVSAVPEVIPNVGISGIGFTKLISLNVAEKAWVPSAFVDIPAIVQT